MFWRRFLQRRWPFGIFSIILSTVSTCANSSPRVAQVIHVLRAAVAMERAMARQGVDLEFGQSLLGRLRDLGLSDAGADAGLSMWTAGSAGACVLRSYLNQFREPMIKGGHITADEFEHDWKRLD